MKRSKKNKINTKPIIGDKRTHGSRNVPFFWNSSRYYNENVYHAISTSLWILTILFFIAFIITSAITKGKVSEEEFKNITLGLSVPTFISIFIAVICKLKERKIRKQRIWDLAGTTNRTIE